ncbi:MAG: hypothetical protein JWN52_2969 [Actinomycetia bacterium]|nr:hypothetical protein [Actinomycetes bacterium]
MSEGHEMRWGGLAGLGSVILAVIGGAVMGGAPKVTDSTGTIAAYLSDHRGQIMTAAMLYAIAIVLFVWFGAALATAFRRADETSDTPAVVLAGFVLVSAIGFIAVSVFAGMAYAMTAHRGLLIFAAGPYTALTVVGTIAGIAVALPLGACAVAIMRTHVFPMWMAWFAGVVALIRVLAALTAGVTGGALVPGGWLASYIPGVLVGLWVLAASGLLVYEHLPVVSARTPPRAMGHA